MRPEWASKQHARMDSVPPSMPMTMSIGSVFDSFALVVSDVVAFMSSSVVVAEIGAMKVGVIADAAVVMVMAGGDNRLMASLKLAPPLEPPATTTPLLRLVIPKANFHSRGTSIRASISDDVHDGGCGRGVKRFFIADVCVSFSDF